MSASAFASARASSLPRSGVHERTRVVARGRRDGRGGMTAVSFGRRVGLGGRLEGRLRGGRLIRATLERRSRGVVRRDMDAAASRAAATGSNASPASREAASARRSVRSASSLLFVESATRSAAAFCFCVQISASRSTEATRRVTGDPDAASAAAVASDAWTNAEANADDASRSSCGKKGGKELSVRRRGAGKDSRGHIASPIAHLRGGLERVLGLGNVVEGEHVSRRHAFEGIDRDRDRGFARRGLADSGFLRRGSASGPTRPLPGRAGRRARGRGAHRTRCGVSRGSRSRAGARGYARGGVARAASARDVLSFPFY